MRRLMLALILAAAAAGCDGYTSVQGRVVDAAGKPVPQATVKLVENPDRPGVGHTRTATTDEGGQFSVGMTHAPTKNMPFLFEVGKKGFVPYEERLTGTASYEKEIVLQPASD